MITLEQQRAKYAWEKAKNNNNKKYKSLAKGAPALIMSNGLMPSLAFWQSKPETQPMVTTILGWLKERKFVSSDGFIKAMGDLQNSDMVKFRDATEETLELLKWLRNFASAVCQE